MTSGSDKYGQFLVVRDFLSQHLNLHPHAIHRDSRLIQELGVDGQKAVRLMNLFRAEFGIDLTEFHFDRHFCPPAAFGSWEWIGSMVREVTGWDGLDPAKPMVQITVRDLANALDRKRLWTSDLLPKPSKPTEAAAEAQSPHPDPVSTPHG
jgi:acyl carrier protein